MICLTGDTHHDTLDTNEQLWLREQGQTISEIDVSLEYVQLCAKYDVKCTLYVTGRTLADQWTQFEPIAAVQICEVAGHTFEAFPRPAGERRKAMASGGVATSHAGTHGSYEDQDEDVRRMCEIALERLGAPIVSWRNHGFVHDANTDEILYAHGIRYVSDDLNWDKLYPEQLDSGLISHPVNVIMDHDHLYHAHRTPAYVEKQRENWSFTSEPTSESFTIERWGELVVEQVTHIAAAGGVATVLAHPICMYTADHFATFERLLQQFAVYPGIHARDVGQRVPGNSGEDDGL